MTVLSDLPKLAQREPFVWTVSLVEPPPAPIQPPTIQPPSPPSQATETRPQTTPIVRAIQSVPQIQQVHEVVRREVREPRPVLQEVMRAERLPAPHAHELVQRDTSEARPPVQEAGPLTQQTQQVVSQASVPVSTNGQEVSVETQSIPPATQSIGAIQSVTTAQQLATATPQAVATAGTRPIISGPSEVAAIQSATAPLQKLVTNAGGAAGAVTQELVHTGNPASTTHGEPVQKEERSVVATAPLARRLVTEVPAPAQPSPLGQAKAESYPTPTGLPTPTNLRTKADYGWLAQELWNRVERLKRYPRLARMHGWEGKVVVRAVIKADGSLVHEAVEESSGYEALDQDALDLMKQVCPLALKHQLGQQQVVVHVPIHYRIEQ